MTWVAKQKEIPTLYREWVSKNAIYLAKWRVLVRQRLMLLARMLPTIGGYRPYAWGVV
jgi:hypothetical protein